MILVLMFYQIRTGQVHMISTSCSGFTFYTQPQACTPYFDVLLTVHLSIILAINKLNAQNLDL